MQTPDAGDAPSKATVLVAKRKSRKRSGKTTRQRRAEKRRAWREIRDVRKRLGQETRERRADFTRRARAAVRDVLRPRWDKTGRRIGGLPGSAEWTAADEKYYTRAISIEGILDRSAGPVLTKYKVDMYGRYRDARGRYVSEEKIRRSEAMLKHWREVRTIARILKIPQKQARKLLKDSREYVLDLIDSLVADRRETP